MLQILRYFDGHFRQIYSHNHSVIKTKLLSRLTKARHHLENQKVNSVILHYLLLLLLFEVNRVWYASSSFDDFIDHIVTNRTILKTDNVDD
jgi:hypothetical protein